MGQKVNPHGARVGVILDWSTKWYAGKKDFSNNLIEDYKLRQMLKEKLYQAGISHLTSPAPTRAWWVTIYTAKPGIVIGRGGAGAEAVKNDIAKLTGRPVNAIQLDIMEIKHPDTNAPAGCLRTSPSSLKKRISFRRAMKQTIGRAMKAGAKGIKTSVSGAWAARTSPAARVTTRVPSRCRRCAPRIDYGFAEAKTTYAASAVKVWIYKGQVLPKGQEGPAGRRPQKDGRREISHADAQESKAPQGYARPHCRARPSAAISLPTK